MQPEVLGQRLELLKRGGYNVLPLGEGLHRMQAEELPSKSVAITFDDGGYDFYSQAFPLIKSYGFPVTVYQTTDYGDYQKPIFNLVCSYILWKRRGSVLQVGKELGLTGPLDLRTETSRAQIVRTLVLSAHASNLTGVQQNDVAARLAQLLDVSYDEILANRMFQLMNPSEQAELAAAGVDFQLHTHRHRTPIDQNLFRKEIQDNRRHCGSWARKPSISVIPAAFIGPSFFPGCKRRMWFLQPPAMLAWRVSEAILCFCPVW